MSKNSLISCGDLLNETRICLESIDKAKQRYAKELAPDFHLIDSLKHKENDVSHYIVRLLDPKDSHSQGDLFLNEFIQLLGDAGRWIGTSEIKGIHLEKQANDKRRIDIYLEFENGVVGIENKPWAKDQDNQIKDYADFIKNEADRLNHPDNWVIIYLCNDDPSEESIGKDERQQITEDGHYLQLDFDQAVSWLEATVPYVKAPKVKLFVEELATFIRREINGEYEMTEIVEIRDMILQSPKGRIDSLFRLQAVIEPLKSHLLDKLRKELDAAVKNEKMVLVWSEEDDLKNGKKESGFEVRFGGSQNLCLRFYFEDKGLNCLGFGIYFSSFDHEQMTQHFDRIEEAMNENLFVGYEERVNGWPWWANKSCEGFLDYFDEDECDWKKKRLLGFTY